MDLHPSSIFDRHQLVHTVLTVGGGNSRSDGSIYGPFSACPIELFFAARKRILRTNEGHLVSADGLNRYALNASVQRAKEHNFDLTTQLTTTRPYEVQLEALYQDCTELHVRTVRYEWYKCCTTSDDAAMHV